MCYTIDELEENEEMFDECLSCGSIWGVGSEEWQFQICDCCGWRPGYPTDEDDLFEDDDSEIDYEPFD